MHNYWNFYFEVPNCNFSDQKNPFSWQKLRAWQIIRARINRNKGIIIPLANEYQYMKDHIFELWRNKLIIDWWSQLYTQLKQLWDQSLKKLQAWMGVRIIPIEGEKCKWIMKDHIFELRRNKLIIQIDHDGYTHNISSCVWMKIIIMVDNIHTWLVMKIATLNSVK